jgi:FtsZ-binding cell division protein ZapB
MASAAARVEEADSLASLEERITRAIALVTQLRHERDAALQRAESLAAELAERDTTADEIKQLQAQNSRLLEEIAGLKSERRQVRTRIEKLLGQMDLLSST